MPVSLAYTILYIFVFIIGSCFGSFLNVLIYRVPKCESFAKGRSHCPGCGKTLRFFDMIPVLSWFILKGKCRDCKCKISFRYPLVEIIGGILAMVCVWQLDFSIDAVIAFFAMSMLTAISFVDWDTMEIPNGFLLWLLVPGALSFFFFEDILWYQRIIGFFAVSLPMFLIASLVSGAFGGGDIKLMAVCGLLLGWQNILVAMFLGLLLGGIYAIYLLISKKSGAKEHFAFGPFLSLGIMVAMLWGGDLINLYLGMFLI
ncbi:MAG: prepilin peptidase [Oscillospiraceae bacterium]